MLVVDATKGMQTQTAECLVIGQIVCRSMLVVLNKVDLLPADKKDAMVEKLSKKLRLTFQQTKFPQVEVLPVSAKPGGPEASIQPEGLQGLLEAMARHCYLPQRESTGGGSTLL